MRYGQRGQTWKVWRNDDGRKWIVGNAAIRLSRMLGRGIAAIMPSHVRVGVRQADSNRHQERTDKYDGYDCPLKKAALHDGSLP
ncbi:MAG: hypothetical protein P4K94_05795 [Terracidiphilus sp.]|nr:hypothetical protein [Terracidiphilus sp.]